MIFQEVGSGTPVPPSASGVPATKLFGSAYAALNHSVNHLSNFSRWTVYSADPYEMRHTAATHMGVHCLLFIGYIRQIKEVENNTCANCGVLKG